MTDPVYDGYAFMLGGGGDAELPDMMPLKIGDRFVIDGAEVIVARVRHPADLTRSMTGEDREIMHLALEKSRTIVAEGVPVEELKAMRDEIAFLRAKVTALEAAQEWRTIESAPRPSSLRNDRINVLFWNGKECVVGYVDPDDGDGYGDQYVCARDGEQLCARAFGLSDPEPTHWMSLPAPPKVTL